MARLVVRFYRRRTVRLGPVALEAYTLERVEELEGDIVEFMGEVSERYRGSPEWAVEAAEVQGREERRVAVYTSGGGPLLFPRPALLKSVTVLDAAAVSASPQPLHRMPRYQPPGELYVYTGSLAVEMPGVYAVLLETDKGLRLVRPGEGMKRDSNSERGR